MNSKRSKPVVKDIADSLGKMPPQALELEEAIIGALLISSTAYDSVKEKLKPEYFYIEKHRLICETVRALHIAKEKIDLKTVVYELKKTGHLELVGGPSAVVEITNKVSSTAHLEQHIRIITELYVKRSLIQLASAIHQNAYEDSSDAIEMLDKSVQDLLHLSTSTFKSDAITLIKQQWKEKQVTEQPVEAPPILHIDATPVAWPGGHTLVVGKKKSRKTLFMVLMISEYIKANKSTGDDVLVFDTEQAKRHVYKIREKVDELTEKKIAVFYLRGMSPTDRQDFIRHTVEHWPVAPQLVIIDGIRDIMNDINDTKESTQTLVWLEKITLTQRKDQKHPAHVINVLHLNKGDSNPRGHIGTELQNKADCTIELSLDEKSGATDVKCESSRERPFNTFSFTHDKNDLPMVVQHVADGEVLNSDERIRRLEVIFEDAGGPMKRIELENKVQEHFGVGQRKCRTMIQEFRRYGWIVKSGKDNDPTSVFKLMVSSKSKFTPPSAMDEPKVEAQMELGLAQDYAKPTNGKHEEKKRSRKVEHTPPPEEVESTPPPEEEPPLEDTEVPF